MSHPLQSYPFPVPVPACHPSLSSRFKRLGTALGQSRGLKEFGPRSNGPTVSLTSDAAGPGGTCCLARALYRSGYVTVVLARVFCASAGSGRV